MYEDLIYGENSERKRLFFMYITEPKVVNRRYEDKNSFRKSMLTYISSSIQRNFKSESYQTVHEKKKILKNSYNSQRAFGVGSVNPDLSSRPQNYLQGDSNLDAKHSVSNLMPSGLTPNQQVHPEGNHNTSEQVHRQESGNPTRSGTAEGSDMNPDSLIFAQIMGVPYQDHGKSNRPPLNSQPQQAKYYDPSSPLPEIEDQDESRAELVPNRRGDNIINITDMSQKYQQKKNNL